MTVERKNVARAIGLHQIGLRQRMDTKVHPKIKGSVQIRAIDSTWAPLVDLTWTNVTGNARIHMGARDLGE